MRSVNIVLSAIYGLSITLASQVCSPDQCLDGKGSSRILASDVESKVYLTPGRFTPGHDDISSSTNQSISHSNDQVVISTPPQPVFFTSTKYRGGLAEDDEWTSAYLPEGWYGLVEPGKALWGAIPKSGHLPETVRTSVHAVLSTCNPPCASGGICTSNTPSNSSSTGTLGSCQCLPGWTGPSCDICAIGHFGPSCAPCTENWSICDDGLSGTGNCLGTSTTALQACDCLHGTCTGSGECACSAGYRSDNSTGTKCTDCQKGFFADDSGNCSACPLGCTSCQLKQGTSNTPECTTCHTGLQLSNQDPPVCSAQGQCSDGDYYDGSTSSCRRCSPACATCTGPSADQCLACTPPRANLNGQCVGYDATTGVCDSSLSALQGVFIVNNGKRECDSCPVGCATCSIRSFSSSSSFAEQTCQSCQDGYLLQGGSCVRSCTEGWFLASPAERNGTCTRCDASCVDCVGSAGHCTKCPPPMFAQGGTCQSTCPTSSIGLNGTCTSCSPDCATCASPSSSSCVTCPPHRPVLRNGRCYDACLQDEFFDSASQACKTCDATCGACVGPSSRDCTTCKNDQRLNKGSCVSSDCGKGGFVPTLGLCLSDMVEDSHRGFFGFLALLPVLALLGLGVWLYIRRQRRQTRQATDEFRNAIDDREVRDRMMILRLEKVLGLDRVAPSIVPPRSTDPGVKTKEERKKLRELLLPSRKRARDVRRSTTNFEDIPLDDKTGDWDVKGGKGLGPDRQSHWFNPPPPYSGHLASTSASGSTDTIATQDLPISNPTPIPRGKTSLLSQTKIVSMSSPTEDDSEPISLRPPLRSNPSSRSIDVKTPLGSGPEDGRPVNRRVSLKKLWPAMPSPVFGQEQDQAEDHPENRLNHAWI